MKKWFMFRYRLKADIHYIIDRIEDGFAVLEDPERHMTELPLSYLPPEVREGNKLELDKNGNWTVIDNSAEHEDIQKRFNALFKKKSE